MRLEEAEESQKRGARKQLQELDDRVRGLESALSTEQQKSANSSKMQKALERKLKEAQFKSDEEQKNIRQLQELVAKLQKKNILFKNQVDEARKDNSVNQMRLRKANAALEDSDERAANAENELQKARRKVRGDD